MIIVSYLWHVEYYYFIGDCTEGSIRLVGGSSSLEGKVEVCVDIGWGTVCDGEWGTADANVACRQLGLPNSGIIICTLHMDVQTSIVN